MKENYGINTTITNINIYASKRVPFKKNENLVSIGRKISDFQKKIFLKKDVIKSSKKDNSIALRQKRIINSLIKENRLTCNQSYSNFGLTTLPNHIQTERNGTNLTQPYFPIEAESNGKKNYIQLVITAYENLQSLEIKFNGLNSNSIECFLGDYVFCNPSPYFNNAKWYQDPVFPFDRKNNVFQIKHAIKKFNSYPIWLRIDDIPKSLNFEISSLSSSNAKVTLNTSISVKKTLHHRKNLNLKVLNSYYPGWTDYYYQDSLLVEQNKNYNMDFIKKYNLDPTLLYCSEETGLFPDLKSNINNNGPIVIHNFQKFKDIYLDTLKQQTIIKSIQKKEKYLESINQLHNSIVYLFDELPEDQNYKLVWVSNWLKKAGIRSKLLTTSPYLSGKEKIDIWCVLLQDYDKIKSVFNKEKWIYICNSTAPPFPNILIESNKKEFDKLYDFLSKRPEIKGFLYYATNNWRGNLINHEAAFQPISKTNKEILKNRYLNKRWPSIPWISYSYKNFNGDGYLYYPNEDGKFIPSTRLFLYHNLLMDLKNPD